MLTKSRTELEIMEFEKAIHAVINRHFKSYINLLGYDEMYAVGLEALWRAIETYNDEGQKLGYYYSMIKYEIYHLIQKEARAKEQLEKHSQASTMGDIDEVQSLRSNANVEEDVNLVLLVSEVEKRLNDREKRLFNLQMLGYTQQEIAEKTNLSQATVCRVLKTIRNTITDITSIN